MKIGIFGGTFNPIHNGHVHLLTEFYSRLKLDKMLLIPTNIPPHKNSVDLLSNKDRLAILNATTKGMNINIEVSDIEMRREEKSYTALTLVELRKLYPKDSFYFIMGEDMFLTLDKWYLPEVIFKEATICATPRSIDGMSKLIKKAQELSNNFSNFKYIIEDIPYMEVSSTEIRENKEKREALLPKPCLDYINKNNLY